MIEIPEFKNVKILFGLEAQGKITTIEKMLSENKAWEEIGKAISWCPKTAKEHYENYLKNVNKKPDKA
jgi:C4-type Zn-finger protein